MKPQSLFRSTIAGFIALACLLPLGRAAWAQDPVCSDVAERGYLTILTVNILYSETRNRNSRLTELVDFITSGDVAGEVAPLPDVILLQEVVGGFLADTSSSARDVQRLLSRRGVDFELRSATEFGLPGVLTVGNATLSRCDIVLRLVGFLPPATEIEVAGQPVPVPRNVLMTRIAVPGFGGVNVYNTHLCAFCPVEQRGRQLEALLDFVDDVENFLPGEDPVVLGGDFNISIFEDGERELYDRLVASGDPREDFIDAYVAAAGEGLEQLCDPGGEPYPDEHCTYGVTPLSDPDIGRIDYVFTRNFGPVPSGMVLFNPLIDPAEPTVSDHAGVLVRVELPASGSEREAFW